MKYDADYFIKFFEAIPDRKWCKTDDYCDGWLKHSAQGHLCDASKDIQLFNIFFKAFKRGSKAINDGGRHCPARFRKFKRPKTRILHALKEARDKGY